MHLHKHLNMYTFSLFVSWLARYNHDDTAGISCVQFLIYFLRTEEVSSGGGKKQHEKVLARLLIIHCVMCTPMLVSCDSRLNPQVGLWDTAAGSAMQYCFRGNS